MSHFVTAINLLIGSAGALALVDADNARYAKNSKDVFLMALAGSIMMDILIVITGSILVYVGFPVVQKYYVALGMSTAQAGQAALNNVAATFIIIGGIVGTLLMIFAQSKAQVLNTYSGSLSLSNFFDVFGWRPGRLFMVVLGNIIGLAMIAGNILGLINNWLTVLGVITTSLAVVMITDYYIVQKKVTSEHIGSEAVNWAGVISVVFGSVIAMYLYQAQIFTIPFITACVISLVVYPLLRLYVLRPSASEFRDSIFHG
jgi:cytosine permease